MNLNFFQSNLRTLPPFLCHTKVIYDVGAASSVHICAARQKSMLIAQECCPAPRGSWIGRALAPTSCTRFPAHHSGYAFIGTKMAAANFETQVVGCVPAKVKKREGWSVQRTASKRSSHLQPRENPLLLRRSWTCMMDAPHLPSFC